MDKDLKDPIISVIMPVYNAELYVGKSIDSILNQTYKDFEFIIINDGSTDKSLEIIKSFSDPRIKIISHTNKGIIYSLNEGMAVSKGKYIARMDADDISLIDRFEKQISFLETNPTIAMCGTWAEVINDSGLVTGSYEHPPINSVSIRSYILWHNPFIHPTVMMRRDIFKNTDWYDSRFKHAEDYELWTRIVFNHDVANIPEKLLQYRITNESITRKNNLSMRIMGIKVRYLSIFRRLFSRFNRN
jgi:glycosyltransferase involved in cell wall biosynthesis